jgi:hypothetical protein
MAALQLQDLGCSGGAESVTYELCKLPAIAHISSHEMVRLLEKLLSLRCNDDDMIGTAGWFAADSLCKVVTHQSTSYVAEMLAAAAEGGADGAVDELCDCCSMMPGAQQLSATEVLPALEAAVRRGSDVCIEALCKLPGAQQLSSEAVAQLLHAAASDKDCDCRMLLLLLPAARAEA